MGNGDFYLFSFCMVVALVAIGGLVYLNDTQGAEIREIRKELDAFCEEKGYDQAISRFLKEFAGDEYVQCIKRIVILDENGVAEFVNIRDYFFFKEVKK